MLSFPPPTGNLASKTGKVPSLRLLVLSFCLFFLLLPAAQAIYTAEFSGKSLGKDWKVAKTGQGQVRVSTEFQPIGYTHHLVFDSKQAGVDSVAEATLQFPLSNYYGVTLSFGARSLGNRPDVPPEGIFDKSRRQFDGVSVSNDGVRWISIQSLAGIGPNVEWFNLPLDEAAGRLGGFGKKFLIRFSWRGNGIAGTDGMAIDQVRLNGAWDNRVTVIAPPVITEGAPPVKLRLTRRLPTKNPTTIFLSQVPPGVLQMPASVTFPPKAGSVEFEVSATDDGMLDPDRKTVIHAYEWFAGGLGTAAVRVGDITPLALELEMPDAVTEGDAAKEGRLAFNRPPDSGLTVTLARDSDQLVVPASVAVPFGEMTVNFPVQASDDWLVDGNAEVKVSASYPGGSALASVIAVDDDAAELRITLPDAITEGSGVPGTVRLGAGSAVPVTVSLDAGPHLSVEPTTVVLTGPSFAAGFTVRAPDDSVAGPVRRGTLRATAAGYAGAEKVVRLLDDEPGSLLLEIVTEVVVPGLPFSVRIQALDADGGPLSSVNGPLSLQALYSDGRSLPPSPSSVTLQNGVWKGQLMPAATGGIPVALTATHAAGTTATSGLDFSRTLPWKAADLAVDPVRGKLYAAIPKFQPQHSNTILAIDPASGDVTGSLLLSNDPFKLAITDGGEYLYVALEDRSSIEQIDLASFTVVRTIPLGGTSHGATFRAMDMTTVAGKPDLLVVTLREAFSTGAGGAVVFENGVARPEKIEMFGGNTVLIERSDDPSLFYSYNSLSTDFGFEWVRLSERGIRVEQRFQGLFTNSVTDNSWGVEADIVSDGPIVFHTNGRRVDGRAPRRLQGFALEGPVRPDLAAGRVYFLGEMTDQSVGRYDRLIACDAEDSVILFELELPESHGSPGSFLRWGDTGLAFRSDKGITLFNGGRSLPATATSDLSLSVEASSAAGPVGGSFTFTVDVANAGPDAAPGNRLAIDLSGCDLESVSAPGMAFVQSGSTLDFSSGTLAAGESMRVVLTVTGASRTFAACSARAFAAAIEATPADNSDAAMVVVGYEPGDYSFNHLDLPVSDLVRDDRRGVIWMALRGTAGPGLGRTVVSLDPGTGQAGAAIELRGEPAGMVISDNGEYLYVAMLDQPEVKRIHLPTRRIDLQVPMGSGFEGARLFAGDMEVLKGDGRSLLVSRYDPSVRPPHEGVAVYDDGVMRPAVTQGHTGSDMIEASADPSVFFGLNTDSSLIEFRHLRVDASGVTEVEARNSLFAAGFGGDLKSAGDTVFSSDGGVVDGKHFEALGAFGTGGPFVPDVASGRVYFFEYGAARSAISVWDADRFAPLFSVSLPQNYSDPRSFIRWGINGLAFRTDTQVAIFSDPQLVPSEPEADLTVDLQANPVEVPLNGLIAYQVTLTNDGPYPAKDCQVSVNLSGGQSFESAGGVPHVESEGWITFLPGEMSAGETRVMTVAARAGRPGSASCSATVISSSVDSSTAGNSATVIVPVGFDPGPDAINRIDLTTTGLIEDRLRGLVWASVPYAGPGADRVIVSLDPATGLVVDRIPLPHIPGNLAISKNGTYLYAGLLDRQAVQRINLLTKEPDLIIPLASDRYAGDIQVLDGDGRSIILSLKNRSDSLGYSGIAVYDDAVLRSLTHAPGIPLPFMTRIEPGADPGTFFGVNTVTTWPEFSRFKLEGNLLTVLSASTSLISNFPGDIRSEGHLVFSTRGEVIDGSVPARLESFNAYGLALPALAANRVLYLESGSFGGTTIRQRISAHDARTRSQVLELPVPAYAGQAADFIRAGSDRFAYRTDDAVYLVRSSLLLPTGPSADLAVTLQANPVPAVAAQPLAYTIQVTNHGANPVSDVVVGAILSPYQSIGSVQAGVGSHQIDGQRVRFSLASLAAGATATFGIQVTPATAGPLGAMAGATSANVDPQPANNSASVDLVAGFVSGSDTARGLRQPANDLIEDPARGRVWASVPATGGTGSVVAVDPASGRITDTLEFPGDPKTLAISKNGRYLYVALTDRPEILRLDLEAKRLDLTIPLGGDSSNRHFRADDMVVIDGPGTSVLVARNEGISSLSSGLAVYDDATMRQVVISGEGNGSRIEPSGDPAVFYLFNPAAYSKGLRKVRVDGLGVSVVAGASVFGGDYQVGDIRADGNQVLTSGGKLADGDTLTRLGIFPGSTLEHPGQPPVVVPVSGIPWIDAATKRAYFLAGGGIRGFSTETFTEIPGGPSINGAGMWSARKMIRWGQDGFAVLGDLYGGPTSQSSAGILFLRWTAAPYPPRTVVASGTGPVVGSWPADPAEDRDGDGVTDGFEQLFGTPPTEPGSLPLDLAAPLPWSSTLSLRFPRRAGAFPRPYRYAVSSDLRNWHPPESVTERVTGTAEKDGVLIEMIEAEVPKPSPDKGFIRLEWAEESP